jgi:hypothetical protein
MSSERGRSGGLFSGIVILLLGVLLLMRHRFPGFDIEHLLRYWPVLLIFWGLVRLYEVSAARREGATRPALLGGGEAVLLLLGILLVAGVLGADWLHRQDPDLGFSMGAFDKTATDSVELSPVSVPAGAKVSITTGRGGITVHTVDKGEMRVVVTRTAHGTSDRRAQERLRDIIVSVKQEGDSFAVQPLFSGSAGDEAQVDLDVELPKQVNLTVLTTHGDIAISDVAGTVHVTSASGEVEVHNAGADVNAETQHGTVRLLGVGGNVHLSGHGEEVEFADVQGSVLIEGEYYGPVRIRNVGKTTRFVSTRTELTLGPLPGHLESDSGEMSIANSTGNLTLTTKEKNITLEDVKGRIQVENRNGNVEVRLTQPPKDDILITNESGNVSVTLPDHSSFTASLYSKTGDIDSDFSAPTLKTVEQSEDNRMEGNYGGQHGPTIKLETSYGTIELKKDD